MHPDAVVRSKNTFFRKGFPPVQLHWAEQAVLLRCIGRGIVCYLKITLFIAGIGVNWFIGIAFGGEPDKFFQVFVLQDGHNEGSCTKKNPDKEQKSHYGKGIAGGKPIGKGYIWISDVCRKNKIQAGYHHRNR